jgi:SAM-dependent methyltransferase
MTKTSSARQRYLHGTGSAEQRRLEAQAELLGGDVFLPPVTRGMRVIDIGCGTGAIARRVASRVGHGQVVGLDREPEQIATARELLASADINLTFQIGSAEELPYPDRSFDAAYCRFLLEHVSDPSLVLEEMARVVKQDGWICALEWEPDGLVMNPDCPNVLEVWQAIYRFQAATGVDPCVGRKLYGLFRQAGLLDVRASTLAWSVTAGDPQALQLYVSGAREIIRQVRSNLVRGRYVERRSLDLALQEYERLLSSPSAFVSHVFCRAVGIRP